MTMTRISQHHVLLSGESFAHCSQQARKFFDLTSLVIYDCIEIRKENSLSGLDKAFWGQLERYQEKNRAIVKRLLSELTQSGIKTTEDILLIEQGYLSKTFHILSHFLDGFVGIDSYFYNLLDDSHWVPEHTRKAIEKKPGGYWLLHVEGFATTTEGASLLHSK